MLTFSSCGSMSYLLAIPKLMSILIDPIGLFGFITKTYGKFSFLNYANEYFA